MHNLKNIQGTLTLLTKSIHYRKQELQQWKEKPKQEKKGKLFF
jgi:hypothetical protein